MCSLQKPRKGRRELIGICCTIVVVYSEFYYFCMNYLFLRQLYMYLGTLFYGLGYIFLMVVSPKLSRFVRFSIGLPRLGSVKLSSWIIAKVYFCPTSFSVKKKAFYHFKALRKLKLPPKHIYYVVYKHY